LRIRGKSNFFDLKLKECANQKQAKILECGGSTPLSPFKSVLISRKAPGQSCARALHSKAIRAS
jgi:hypothetical protein